MALLRLQNLHIEYSANTSWKRWNFWAPLLDLEKYQLSLVDVECTEIYSFLRFNEITIVSNTDINDHNQECVKTGVPILEFFSFKRLYIASSNLKCIYYFTAGTSTILPREAFLADYLVWET